MEKMKMKLYYHKTDGGAEYLCSEAVEGTEEGSFNSKYVVRIDGNIEKDAELNIKDQLLILKKIRRRKMNKEERKAYMKEYYKNNKGKFNKEGYHKKWRKENQKK